MYVCMSGLPTYEEFAYLDGCGAAAHGHDSEANGILLADERVHLSQHGCPLENTHRENSDSPHTYIHSTYIVHTYINTLQYKVI